MKSIFLFITSILFLSSCNSPDISQTKYRNSDYVWFMPENTKKGEWIKIDNSNTKSTIKDGHCTKFYKNGGIREKYTLDNQGKSDTVYYFNLLEEISHYSFTKDKKINNHYLKDGYFEAYSPNAEIIVKGTVKNNKLENFNFEGNLKTFQTLFSSSTKVWFLTNNLVQNITRASTLRQKNNELTVPKNTLVDLENLRIKTIKYTSTQINKQNEFQVNKKFDQLKKTTLEFNKMNKKVLVNEFGELIKAMHNEFTEENLKTMTSISLRILKTTKEADKMLEQEQIKVSREMKAADHLVPLFERKKKELLNQ